MAEQKRLDEQASPVPSPHTEGEFYAEPAKLTRKDVAGVILALVALAVIGISGYIWLNPNLSASQLFAKPAAPQTAAAPVQSAESATPAVASYDSVLASANGNRRAECPQCGMTAGASEAEVVAEYGDGSIQHFDSWICAFDWGKAQGQPIAEAVAMVHGSTPAAPEWVDAMQAAFLYDTKRIPGSMPPYVAAFAGQDAAAAAQRELGGQIVHWNELQQKFAE